MWKKKKKAIFNCSTKNKTVLMHTQLMLVKLDETNYKHKQLLIINNLRRTPRQLSNPANKVVEARHTLSQGERSNPFLYALNYKRHSSNPIKTHPQPLDFNLDLWSNINGSDCSRRCVTGRNSPILRREGWTPERVRTLSGWRKEGHPLRRSRCLHSHLQVTLPILESGFCLVHLKMKENNKTKKKNKKEKERIFSVDYTYIYIYIFMFVVIEVGFGLVGGKLEARTRVHWETRWVEGKGRWWNSLT